MLIRRANLSDLDTVVQYNYNLAYETEGKKLNKEILYKGVKRILQAKVYIIFVKQMEKLLVK